MIIDREKLEAQKAIFERQREEHARTLAQIEGGIATCNHFLTLLDKPEPQQPGASDGAEPVGKIGAPNNMDQD